jgi:hypothetical protein
MNKKSISTPFNSLNSQAKDTKFIDQLNKVYNVFFERPSTMKEVDIVCGVMRENICWYVRTLRKAGKIYLINKRACKVTKHTAGEYTTNPALIPIDKQTKLF